MFHDGILSISVKANHEGVIWYSTGSLEVRGNAGSIQVAQRS